MKKLVFAIACTLAVASCNQDAAKKVEQVAQQQRDSLEQILRRGSVRLRRLRVV